MSFLTQSRDPYLHWYNITQLCLESVRVFGALVHLFQQLWHCLEQLSPWHSAVRSPAWGQLGLSPSRSRQPAPPGPRQAPNLSTISSECKAKVGMFTDGSNSKDVQPASTNNMRKMDRTIWENGCSKPCRRAVSSSIVSCHCGPTLRNASSHLIMTRG